MSLGTAIIVQIVPTAFTEAYFEALTEMSQDVAKAGYLNLGSGNDTRISAATGTSQLINAQGGDDFVAIEAGNDFVFGGSGNDWIFAGRGDDQLNGGSGNDTLEGGANNDQLSGGSGADQLWGGSGTDILRGGTGDDQLYGDHDGSATSQQGNDTLDGGAGNDILSGGGGADQLIGGFGKDTFKVETHLDLGMGHTDVIRDFSRAEGDLIDLRAIDADLTRPGNQDFVFSNGPSTQAGRLWLGEAANGQQTVFMNIDGGAADVSLIVRFDDPAITSLRATDFVDFFL